MVLDGALRAEKFGSNLAVDAASVEAAKARKTKPGPAPAAPVETPIVAAEMKAGDVVKTPTSVLARSKTKKATSGTAAKSKSKATAAGKGATAAETKSARKRAA